MYGVEFTGFKTGYQYYNFIGISQEQNDYTTQIGGFVKVKKNFGDRLIFEPGLRIQYYASIPVANMRTKISHEIQRYAKHPIEGCSQARTLKILFPLNPIVIS